jgi:uncharacterized membrane-anchored protein YjiN (DUF445 family)
VGDDDDDDEKGDDEYEDSQYHQYHLSQSLYTVLTTIGDELETNPFMRVNVPGLAEAAVGGWGSHLEVEISVRVRGTLKGWDFKGHVRYGFRR